MFEHHNLQKKGRQASLNINAQNFLYPGQDMGYKADYKYPYVFGRDDTKKTAFTVSAFNARRLSGVFTPGESKQWFLEVFLSNTLQLGFKIDWASDICQTASWIPPGLQSLGAAWCP